MGSAYFGGASAGVGDVNGDGYDDFVVGAYGSDTAYVYLGRAGTPPFAATPITLTGPARTGFGVRVASAGRPRRRRARAS